MSPNRLKLLAISGGVMAALLFLAVFLLPAFFSGGSRGKPDKGTGLQQDDPREIAVETLHKGTDLVTCRGALQQLNLYLGQHPEARPPQLTEEQRETLRKQYGITPDEFQELDSSVFTLLDGQHLDTCFLFRDAVQSLDLERSPPLDQAAAAFAWTVRQVRLQEREGEPLPPSFVLRRGRGTATERALVFLAALHQLGLDGCLVTAPGEAGATPRSWACGVLIDKDLYLFDHRLGLPVPGPGGNGIATLSAVRKAPPDLLAALTVDAKNPYDVTAEQARRSEIQLACPLSDLAPRMKVLQDDLLAPKVRARVAVDAGSLARRFQAVAGTEGTVTAYKPAVRALRRYLPPDEGGNDRAELKLKRRTELELVPFRQLPPVILQMPDILQEIVLGNYYAQPFISLLLEPGKPRDLMLRGRFAEATPVLVDLVDQVRTSKVRLQDNREAMRQLDIWTEQAIGLYADLVRAERVANDPKQRSASSAGEVERARARVNELWKRAEPLAIVVQGHSAEPRGAEAMYLLALCMHEQAVRQQAQLDRARKTGETPDPDQERAVQNAWRDANTWWDTLATDYSNAPAATAGRMLRAQARAALGDTARAAALLRDLSGDLTEPQKVACLYQAQQLDKKPR